MSLTTLPKQKSSVLITVLILLSIILLIVGIRLRRVS